MAEQKPIGKVTHYFNKINVAIVKFNKTIEVGAEIRFKGAHTDFVQKIDSIQHDHKEIKSAKKGLEVGIKVDEKVHENDNVFEA